MSNLNRAAVLIGVQQAPELPELNAVWEGVELMRDWAEKQAFQDVEVIWDKEKGSKVTGEQIFSTVSKICDKKIDQLIIYFSGHGILSNCNEFWLLSQAPRNTNEAISLRGSIELAQYGNVEHVIFVSDACRTTPESVGMGNINGYTIFQNFNAGGTAKEVDVFYATAPGEPAFEIADSSKHYSGVYTDVLAEALKGGYPEVIDGKRDPKVIWPRKLKSFLKEELPKRVYNMTKKDPRTQVPDAILQSADRWISIFEGTQPVPISGSIKSAAATRYATDVTNINNEINNFATKVVFNPEFEMDRHIRRLDKVSKTFLDASPGFEILLGNKAQLTRTVKLLQTPFEPFAFESKCGFQSRGINISETLGVQTDEEILNRQFVNCHLPPKTNAVSTLLIFENGFSSLLPALQDFVGLLTFDGVKLVDVSYEPARNTDRWSVYEEAKGELTNLRIAAATASRLGQFRLEGESARKLAHELQKIKSFNPSLAVYAAHAFQGQDRSRLSEEVHEYTRSDLGIGLFDIALLAQRLFHSHVDDMAAIYPQLPLLSQAWPLLPVYGIQIPPELEGIERHVHTDSLWTLYDPEGTEKLRNAIEQGILK